MTDAIDIPLYNFLTFLDISLGLLNAIFAREYLQFINLLFLLNVLLALICPVTRRLQKPSSVLILWPALAKYIATNIPFWCLQKEKNFSLKARSQKTWIRLSFHLATWRLNANNATTHMRSNTIKTVRAHTKPSRCSIGCKNNLHTLSISELKIQEEVDGTRFYQLKSYITIWRTSLFWQLGYSALLQHFRRYFLPTVFT